jgi:hypothetical protein
VLFVAIVTILVEPLGGYMERVFSRKQTLLDRFCLPVERLIYRITAVDPDVVFWARGTIMNWDRKESWIELCELAAQERDPTKLLELIGEIDRLLESREQRLAKAPSSVAGSLTKKAS